MSRNWDEQKVLAKLGVEDFRHVTKDSLVTFVSNIDKIDPEVAKEVIKQIPEFAALAKDTLDFLNAGFNQLIESDDKISKELIKSYNLVLESLNEILHENDLSFDEKMSVVSFMDSICDKIHQAVIEHRKSNLAKGVLIVGGAIGALIPLIGALGGNLKIDTPDRPS